MTSGSEEWRHSKVGGCVSMVTNAARQFDAVWFQATIVVYQNISETRVRFACRFRDKDDQFRLQIFTIVSSANISSGVFHRKSFDQKITRSRTVIHFNTVSPSKFIFQLNTDSRIVNICSRLRTDRHMNSM